MVVVSLKIDVEGERNQGKVLILESGNPRSKIIN
jgi:hypothetical protein